MNDPFCKFSQLKMQHSMAWKTLKIEMKISAIRDRGYENKGREAWEGHHSTSKELIMQLLHFHSVCHWNVSSFLFNWTTLLSAIHKQSTKKIKSTNDANGYDSFVQFKIILRIYGCKANEHPNRIVWCGCKYALQTWKNWMSLFMKKENSHTWSETWRDDDAIKSDSLTYKWNTWMFFTHMKAGYGFTN